MLILYLLSKQFHLTHFRSLVPFPKTSENPSFLMFSRGIERIRWPQIGQLNDFKIRMKKS